MEIRVINVPPRSHRFYGCQPLSNFPRAPSVLQVEEVVEAWRHHHLEHLVSLLGPGLIEWMEGFNGWAVATAYRFYLLPSGYDPLEATLSWPLPHPHLWPWGWVSGTLFGDDSGGCGKHKIWFEEAGGLEVVCDI